MVEGRGGVSCCGDGGDCRWRGVNVATHSRSFSSGAQLQGAPNISLSVDNGNDFKRGCLLPVHDGVIWIAGQRPETKRTSCEVRPGVATHRSLGDKGASIVDRLFYAIGGVFVVIGDVRPNIENIRFGERVRT